MRKVLVLFLGFAMLCGTGLAFGQEPTESLGTTCTFRGGKWNEPGSWEPSQIPGLSDNAIIPAGLSATAPTTCDLSTLTVQGTVIVSNLQVQSFEVSVSGQIESIADLAIDCRGVGKNSGKISSSGKFDFKAMGFENSGILKTKGICDMRILGTFTNTGTVDTRGSLLIQSSKVTNKGQIKTSGVAGNIVLWCLGSIENTGSLIANSGLTSTFGSGENGGSIYVACSDFIGSGVVAPGSGGNGNPPGKKGAAVIGSSYEPASFAAQAPPQGAILDESAWKSQTAKANPLDGMPVGASVSGGLTLSPPTNSRPFRYGGFSSIVSCSGGQVTASLKWDGSGTLKLHGYCSFDLATFSPSVSYLRSGETCTVTLSFDQRPEGAQEIRIHFESEDGKAYVSLRLTVFFVKCPIIEGHFGSVNIKVTDDAGKTTASTLNAKPVMKNGVLYVPLRDFIEINHGKVEWDNVNKQATITMPGRSSVITLNSSKSSTSGTSEDLSGKTWLGNGKMMVPADSLANIIGASLKISGTSYIFKYPG